jgi:hypothetical protein
MTDDISSDVQPLLADDGRHDVATANIITPSPSSGNGHGNGDIDSGDDHHKYNDLDDRVPWHIIMAFTVIFLYETVMSILQQLWYVCPLG